MLLKHILSNVNIPNLLDQIKIFLKKNISLISKKLFKNFLHALLKNLLSFINVLFAALRINSRSLVNLDFVLHAEKNTLLFGLKKLLALSLMSNTELFFLLFQKNLENFSSMTEIFLQNLHMLLMIFLNINFIISNLKMKEFIALESILKNILLILILSIMD